MSFDTVISSALQRLRPRRVRNNITERTERAPYEANTSNLPARLLDVFLRTYDLGFTSFGGPPVHFQIFHRRFVDGLGKTPWIDEQTYQELFAVSQALPGPGSTKMLFNIAQIHAGLVPALFVFLIWSLPAGIAMYGFSLGVQRIGEHLPSPAYALLSGLNAATVGIIALAAVQLARKAITDPLMRFLVAFGGCAGLCYTALWYFPVLLVFGGALTGVWDLWGRSWWQRWRNSRKERPRRRSREPEPEAGVETVDVPMEDLKTLEAVESPAIQRRQPTTTSHPTSAAQLSPSPVVAQPHQINISAHAIPIKHGIALLIFFLITFTILMSLRGALAHIPLLLALFNNMFLAGTIIFGGGPVVIPLLRDYVVAPGWVAPRDFLLGLAVIQAMPGPNFNFAVYLGALVLAGPAAASISQVPTFVGALLAFLGIFAPGLWLSVAFQSIWRRVRTRREVVSVLRGVNALAVGLVFTAVYRLWEIGYLTPAGAQGTSLGREPWWLVVAASTFTAVEWFAVPPPVAILSGGVAGLAWWGAVGRRLQR
ncbi:putative chromate transporter [Lyophyllum shimeji]|uniref:Chromate transporter n=1 Tax=Lyophyllum shimeji TaxID=47721 RepID=A0A9P3PX79_LYOSH|nr:putative chromate transporter [Lyophyllum shimeji]